MRIEFDGSIGARRAHGNRPATGELEREIIVQVFQANSGVKRGTCKRVKGVESIRTLMPQVFTSIATPRVLMRS